MSKYVKGNSTTICSTTGWDQMIADARERIRKLELSIKVFSQKKERGEPWRRMATSLKGKSDANAT